MNEPFAGRIVLYMTLAATRRFAFGASLVLGLVATVMAAAIVSVLLSGPEEVAVTMADADLGSLFRVIVDRLADAAVAVARLL